MTNAAPPFGQPEMESLTNAAKFLYESLNQAGTKSTFNTVSNQADAMGKETIYCVKEPIWGWVCGQQVGMSAVDEHHKLK